MPEFPLSYSYEEGCQRQNVAYTTMHTEAFIDCEYFRDFLNWKLMQTMDLGVSNLITVKIVTEI
jgi:hypothetical protein